MERIDFVNNFFEEFKNNGFTDVAKSYISTGLLDNNLLDKLQNITIESYMVEEFSYEKVTKKIRVTETTPEIPRSVETIIVPNKFRCLINNSKKINIFVIGVNENEYKLIGHI